MSHNLEIKNGEARFAYSNHQRPGHHGDAHEQQMKEGSDQGHGVFKRQQAQV